MYEIERSVILETSNLRADITRILTRRIKMLSGLANQYLRIIHHIKEFQIGSITAEKFVIVDQFSHIDNVFTEKDEALIAEYRALIVEHRKNFKERELIDQLDLAIAGCKNKFNLAIFVVRKDAITLKRLIQDAAVQGLPVARLESLKDLTLEKEMMSFYEIIGKQ